MTARAQNAVLADEGRAHGANSQRSGTAVAQPGQVSQFRCVCYPFFFLVLHVRMSGTGCVASSKPSRVSGVFPCCGCAVVSVLSEVCWDDVVSHHQRYQEGVSEEP
jgi:hypothetical protein